MCRRCVASLLPSTALLQCARRQTHKTSVGRRRPPVKYKPQQARRDLAGLGSNRASPSQGSKGPRHVPSLLQPSGRRG
eukprot:scaffold30651_cov32-Tisochrysis_lutea.AAC.1